MKFHFLDFAYSYKSELAKHKIDALEMVGTVLLAHNGNHEKFLL